jgi:hypothetical protein
MFNEIGRAHVRGAEQTQILRGEVLYFSELHGTLKLPMNGQFNCHFF